MSLKGKKIFPGGASGLAALLCVSGALVSGYLFVADFVLGGAQLCLTGGGCDAVRESRYSSIGGIPVALLGFLGYAAMAAVIWGRTGKWNLLFWLSAGAVGFSAYLTYLELFIIQALCSWCVASAAIAAALFALAASKKSGSPLGSLGGAAAVIALVFAVSYSVHSRAPEEAPAAASFYQISLAKYLSECGAVMYGSHTCVHCKTQKDLFGDAFGYITYVECSRSGPDPDLALCAARKIKNYPTWEIGGQFHKGLMTLEKLERVSGYSGR